MSIEREINNVVAMERHISDARKRLEQKRNLKRDELVLPFRKI